ncbi:type II secretion system protein [Pasteurellaceae bacterium 22721_9_1]
MQRGFTLFELLITLFIIALLSVVSLPILTKSDNQMILAKEQQRFYLFLRQIQAKIENSTDIWFLVLNRDLNQQRWCATVQLKDDTTCNCFYPQSCSSSLKPVFYYPLQQQKTMIATKSYYPDKLISFNSTRNSADSGCLLLQIDQYATLFSFSNLGRIRLREGQNLSSCNTGDEE